MSAGRFRRTEGMTSSSYREFADLPFSGKFRADAVQPLISSCQQFLGCRANFLDTPARFARDRYGIDILANPRRGCYIVSTSEALILGRVLVGTEMSSAMGLRLHKGHFNSLGRLLSILEGALSRSITRAWADKFRDVPFGFDTGLLELTVANYCAKGSYNPGRFRYLIREFDKLSRTTFEGEYFTTGLILTRSFHRFVDPGGNRDDRLGRAVRLRHRLRLRFTPTLNRRFWYLADGCSSFFLCDQYHRVSHLFFPEDSSSPLSKVFRSRSFSDSIYGGDALFRVTAGNEHSVTSSDGLEFVFSDNAWRVRSFPHIKEAIESDAPVEGRVTALLIDVLIDISNQRRSALLVIPRNLRRTLRRLASRNRLSVEFLDLTSDRATLVRVLTSDGASILDRQGRLLYYGCIVHSAPGPLQRVRGSGETAARNLAEDAFTIKISEDGAIKMRGKLGEDFIRL